MATERSREILRGFVRARRALPEMPDDVILDEEIRLLLAAESEGAEVAAWECDVDWNGCGRLVYRIEGLYRCGCGGKLRPLYRHPEAK